MSTVTGASDQMEVLDGYDPFLVTFAHEVAHFLQYVNIGSIPHVAAEGVLLSNGKQSTRVNKGLLTQITGLTF